MRFDTVILSTITYFIPFLQIPKIIEVHHSSLTSRSEIQYPVSPFRMMTAKKSRMNNVPKLTRKKIARLFQRMRSVQIFPAENHVLKSKRIKTGKPLKRYINTVFFSFLKLYFCLHQLFVYIFQEVC